MRLLKSVEELLYELVTWILFYPLTLWRCIRRPIRMMKYAESELGDEGKEQYDDALSPPIFLLLSLFVAHLLELRFGLSGKTSLPEFLQDDKNLLLYRAVAYSLFPLLLALLDVRHRGVRLTRQFLRPSFYSQSYMAAPFVLSFDVAVLVGQQGSAIAAAVGIALFALGLVWYCGTQITWFTTVRGVNAGRAVAMVLGTVLLGFAAVLAVLVVTALTTTSVSLGS